MPVMSLRTGHQVAAVEKTIINPFDLSVQAFKLSGRRLERPQNSYLLPDDIREISRVGLIIDDSQEIVASTDVVKLQQILDLNFELIGLPVVDKKRRRIGKVLDFTIVGDAMLVYQLIVKRPLFKDFLDPELTIHRSQIAQITQNQVIIKNELAELRELDRQAAIDNFVNPFRNPKPISQDK